VQARRKRFEPVDAAQTAQITKQFMTAAATGNMKGLLTVLAPDATWTTDHAGKATAARRPIVGAQKAAAAAIRLFQARQRMPDLRFQTVNCNNAPAVIVYSGDHLEAVFLIEIIDGRIRNFYATRNPDKLAAITVPRSISRQRRAVRRGIGSWIQAIAPTNADGFESSRLSSSVGVRQPWRCGVGR
jgi:RNA polymerase sigma-70 factor (ECF subfamily)